MTHFVLFTVGAAFLFELKLIKSLWLSKPHQACQSRDATYNGWHKYFSLLLGTWRPDPLNRLLWAHTHCYKTKKKKEKETEAACERTDCENICWWKQMLTWSCETVPSQIRAKLACAFRQVATKKDKMFSVGLCIATEN